MILIGRIGAQKTDRINHEVDVNGTLIRVIVDTGSPYTIVTEETYESIEPRPWLQRAGVRIRGPSGTEVPLKGAIEVTLEGMREFRVLVVEGSPIPNLLGMDYVRQRKLSIDALLHIDEKERNRQAVVCSVEGAMALDMNSRRRTKCARLAATDEETRALIKVLRDGWPTRVSQLLQPFRKYGNELTAEEGLIFYGQRVLVPWAMREEVLNLLHKGHSGRARMVSEARGSVWWPTLEEDIERLVRECNACQVYARRPAQKQGGKWPPANGAWERIHIDFAGPFYGKVWLIVVDAYTKWIEIASMDSTTTDRTTAVLSRIFERHGLPRTVVSDNGPQFRSEQFAEYLRERGITHITSAPYHPASNGEAERAVQSFKRGVRRVMASEGCAVLQAVREWLWGYRTSVHSTTGVTPAELLYGRRVRTELSQLQKVEWKQNPARRSEIDGTGFPEGSLVWAERPPTEKGALGCYEKASVQRRIGNYVYECVTNEGQQRKYHANQLKRRYESETTESEGTEMSRREASNGVEEATRRSEREHRPPQRYSPSPTRFK